jgi:hypothetical protein
MSIGEVVTTASGWGGIGASSTGGGGGANLVFVSIGAHNPPGASHGVLHPASSVAATAQARPARFFISIDAPT